MRDIIKSLDKNKSYIIAFLIITECVFLFFTYKSFYDRVETIDKTSVVKKEKYSMYIQYGNSYIEYTSGTTFPNGYVLNLTQSRCVDGNDQVVSNALTKTGDKVTVTSNQTLFCTLYFDQDRHFASYLRSLCSSDNTIVAYSGKVTDDVSQIGTGVDATKVCAFRSNTNNNVVFANSCWQIRRTTETGGVKIHYNGEPTLGTDGNGNTTYDCGTSRPYHPGGIRTTQSLSGTKTYGSGYTTSVSGNTTTFTLTGTESIEVTSSNAATVMPTLKDKYICGTGTTTTCTNANLKKIDIQSSGTTAYVYSAVNRDLLGSSLFSANDKSPSDVGYMYNQRYETNNTYAGVSYGGRATSYMLTKVTLNSSNLTTYGNYNFSNSYTLSGDNHILTNPVLGNTIADYPNSWNGMYYCTNSSCTNAYYISGIDTTGTDPVIYVFSIAPGKESDDSTYYKYLIGDGLHDNGDGTLSLTGTVREIIQKDWYDTYSTITSGMYVCMPEYYTYNSLTGENVCFDYGRQSVYAVGYITETTTGYLKFRKVYKYGYGIEADGNSYKLVAKSGEPQTLQYITNFATSSNTNCFTGNSIISSCGYKTVTKSHYTCFNLTGTCNTYYYIFFSDGSEIRYITISGGKYVSTDLTDTNNVLYEMFNASNLNTTNSIVKGVIDSWYENNLLNTNFESLIESSSIFCNDRRIKSFGGWNPDGGETLSILEFTERSATGEWHANGDLSCNRTLDAFSVGNSNARLNYPIGLMSAPEMYLLFNSETPNPDFGATTAYWLSSPCGVVRGGQTGIIRDLMGVTGNLGDNNGYQSGVKPAISLNSSVEFSSGTGSTTDPFVIAGSEMTP